MTCTEEYKEHFECTFHAFCKIVIRNASYTALRTWSRKHKREISLDYITDEKHYPLGTTDEYFQAPEPDEEYILTLCGDTILFDNGLLAESPLPACQRRSGKWFTCPFSSVFHSTKLADSTGAAAAQQGYHIRKALRQLYEEMEGLAHEE